VEHKQELLL